jgi:hypothetical protein
LCRRLFSFGAEKQCEPFVTGSNDERGMPLLGKETSEAVRLTGFVSSMTIELSF